MKILEFADIVHNVIQDQGFDEFLPVACFPERRNIRALAEVPLEANIEEVAIKWATEISEPNEEFLVAFKYSNSEFKIVRFSGAESQHEVFVVV